MDTSSNTSRSRWPLILAGFIGLLVILYLVLTSGAFIRSIVLPKVATALNSELTVDDLSLSPFSSLSLRKLTLKPKGAETLATVEELRVRYSLTAIIGGNIQVDEVTVDSPVLTVVGHADGTSNLSKLMEGLSSGSKESKPETAKSGQLPKLNLHQIAIKNGTLRQSMIRSNSTSISEVSGLNILLDGLVTGSPSKLTLAAALSQEVNKTNRLQVAIDGSYNFEFDPQFMPSHLSGSLGLIIQSATGSFAQAAQIGIKLQTELTATEMKQLQVSMTRGGQTMGELAVSGPLNASKKEASLRYELKGVDRAALGVVGAIVGMDFGQTSIAAVGRVDLSQEGQAVASSGTLSINRFSVKNASGATPVLDVALDYGVRAQLQQGTALVEKLNLSVQQGRQPLVRGTLDAPMSLNWGAGSGSAAAQPATYTLSVLQMDLAPWRSIAGTNLPTGIFSLESQVTSDSTGRRLQFGLNTSLDSLALSAAGKSFNDLALRLKIAGSIEGLQAITVDQVVGEIRHSNRPVADYTAKAKHHLSRGETAAELKFNLDLAEALQLYPVNGIQLRSGTLGLKSQVDIRPGQTNALVDFGVRGLTGIVVGNTLQDYSVRLDSAVAISGPKLNVKRAVVSLRSGNGPEGTLEVSGDIDLPTQRGALDFRTAHIDEKVLGPLLAAAIAPKQLKSLAIDLNGKAQLDARGESALQTSLRIQHFLVLDPTGAFPEQPLALGVELDASQKGSVVDLRRLMVDLGGTAKATNQIQLVGKVDLGTNKPAPSILKLTSDGLDLTPLYEIFAGGKTDKPAARPTDSKPAVGRAAGPAAKPGQPVILPFDSFSFDAQIGRIFLREIAISNLLARVSLQSGKVGVKPISMTLNSAPIELTADIDLSVPGYSYDIAADLKGVPLSPIAKSLLTGDAVELKGALDTHVKLKGAGMEGADLRKNLQGDISFGATRLDYQVARLQNPLLKFLVSTLSLALQLPNLSQSPLDSVIAQMTAGQGEVQIQKARVASAAFAAELNGSIQLADVLTNSTLQLPVIVSLPRDGKMEALPQFLTIRGTLSEPKKDIDLLALASVMTRLPGGAGSLINKGLGKLGGAAEKATGSAGGVGSAVGGLVQGVLGGGTTATTNKAGVNTNTPAKPINPFDLLKKATGK